MHYQPKIRARFIGHRPSGFTLVELLVVIGIIGVLVGMLLPAVQFAREAGRRTVCSNNLRNMGLAAFNFESAQNTFPHGSNFQLAHSWNSALLPYLEQASVFDSLDMEVAADDPSNRTVAATVLNVFCCPSSDKSFPGKTDYSGISGSWISPTPIDPRRLNGIFFTATTANATPVRFQEITDGTSNTICIAESSELLEINNGFWASGFNCFTQERGVNVTEGNAAEIISDHAGGAFATFCDGSVRFIGEDVADPLVTAACTRNGTEIHGAF